MSEKTLSSAEIATLSQHGCEYPWSPRDMLRLIARLDRAMELAKALREQDPSIHCVGCGLDAIVDALGEDQQ